MRPHRNRGLFSNYYLDELLPKEEEFKVPISEVKAVLEKVRGIWDTSRFEAINEDQLRKHFLDKVLDYLGWVVDVNAPVPTGEWSKRPDYAFFLNNESVRTAQKGKKEDYFNKVTCIAEAKRWGRPLDKKLKTEADPFEIQNPSLQISRYLWLTGVRWGILTDGKYWRLYERETSKRLDIFYEIDLEDLIESRSAEDFRYFYLLFRKDSFPGFIEKVYKGSVDYAEEVGEALKGNIYLALRTLAQGFLGTTGNNLLEKSLKEIHDNSLTLLYRLLFILYAEHRDLLPLGVNKLYTESYSLDAFKKEIANRFDKNEPVAASTFGYWSKLKELFEIINGGNKELGVPPYNGGLFDPEKHHFLEKYRIGDLYVAKAIDLLSRSTDKAYIDYGSLEIRHLGSIYEGLLEYKLKIADQDLVPMKDKGKEVFISLAEAKKQKKIIREDEKVIAGEFYLVTDKGERKATGSYYTPDYIVKYIVENTLGPLVEEKRKKVSERIEELKQKIKGARGTSREFHEKELNKVEGSLIDEILSLKVLDPAMGSGHFLVEATDFLARELLKVLSGESLEDHKKVMVVKEPSEPYASKEAEEEDIRWARREVVERCIFGVDLNPMAVELAKLSLWLYTVAKGKPLNFLDHHLKFGNSLVSAKLDEIKVLPKTTAKKEQITDAQIQLPLELSQISIDLGLAVGGYKVIESRPTDKISDVKEKEKIYKSLDKEKIDKWRLIANIWTSSFFGLELDQRVYQALSDFILDRAGKTSNTWVKDYFSKALNITGEKSFFHWELEFPEVFYDHHGKVLPIRGFDAVVGNPPWGGDLNKYEKEYLKLLDTDTKIPNSYIYFMKTALNLLNEGGRHSFVIPDSILVKEYPLLRNYLVNNYHIEQIDFINNTGIKKELQPFPDVNHDIVILLIGNLQNSKENIEVSIRFVGGIVPKIENIPIYSAVPQKYFDDPQLDYRFNLLLNEQNLKLKERVGKNSFLLSEICEAHEGIHTGNIREKLFIDSQKPSNGKGIRYKKLIIGSSHGDIVSRYFLFWNGAYVNYDPKVIDKDKGEYASLREERIFLEPKLFIVRTGDEFYVVFDKESFYASNNLFCMLMKKQEYMNLTLQFIHALLNGRFLQGYLRLYIAPRFGALYTETKIKHLDLLPIPYISFTTPKAERKSLLDEAKKHCIKYLETGKLDTIAYFLESRLLKQHKPDPELVKKHNSDPLNRNWQIPQTALWEQSDVVHDTVAYLSEQMIEMNKEKHDEIKGFLKWLESQLRFQLETERSKGIDAFPGKTQIKNYLGDYQKEEEHLSFEEFWKILEKNRLRFQANLKSRELYQSIRSEYEKSISKLLPLKEKLRKTDELIDQIVYKLYGLTEGEIKIVEVNINRL
jgi:type I restriction-modification system DNA methylase subunit